MHRSGGSIRTAEVFFSHSPRRSFARRWLGALSAVAALGLPSLASAEVSADSVSLGVGVEPLHLASGAGDLLIAGRNAAPLNFYVQVKLLPKLRFETSAAYFHCARDRAHTPAGGSSYDFTATAVGVGAVYYVALPAPIGLYLGGRLTVAHYSGNFTDKPLPLNAPKESTNDFFFAPVVGGELALTHRFFIGTEMQLPFALGGDQSRRTTAGADTPNVRGARLSPNAIVFLKYFVF